jgi:hypothetical protein
VFDKVIPIEGELELPDELLKVIELLFISSLVGHFEELVSEGNELVGDGGN